METIEDFDKWLSEYTPPEVTYVAVFDPSTGKVQSVGPDYAFPNQVNQVPIDRELAQSIISAEIQIEKCLIDINSGKLEIEEIQTLNKLDDVLHRISSVGYTDITDPDVYLTYGKKDKTLKFLLTLYDFIMCFSHISELYFSILKYKLYLSVTISVPLLPLYNIFCKFV